MEPLADFEKRMELIERKLSNELSKEEHELFERMIQEDPGFRDDAEIMQQMSGVLSDPERLQFRAALQQAEKRHKLTAPVRHLHLPRWARYAAAVIIIGAASSPLLYNIYRSTPDNIFNSYYQRYEIVTTTRGHNGQSEMNRALQAFDQAEYDQALSFLSAVLSSAPDNHMAVFYKAMCQMELKEYANAVISFNILIADGANLFVEQSRWYAALGNVKLQHFGEAREHLNYLQSYPNPYREKAATLLKKIKRF